MPSMLRTVQQFFPEVTAVTDATRPAYITVTRKDALTAKAKDHVKCAMALACKRQLHLDGAVVSLGVAYLVKGPKATRYQVPQAVSREIVSFDRGSGFAAGEYALYAPSEWRKYRRTAKKKTGRMLGERRREKPRHMTSNVRQMLSA